MGAIDENGIYQYTEDEAAAPGGLFSELLNLGQSSVSAQVALLSARVTAIEALLTTTQSETTGILTARDGWEVRDIVGYKVSKFGVLSFTYERTGSAISVPVGGNLANVDIADVAPSWAGVVDGYPPFATTSAGRVASAYLTGGDFIRLGAVSGEGDINTGEIFSTAGVYVLA